MDIRGSGVNEFSGETLAVWCFLYVVRSVGSTRVHSDRRLRFGSTRTHPGWSCVGTVVDTPMCNINIQYIYIHTQLEITLAEQGSMLHIALQ
jgi:hypothetical protein